MKHKVTASTTTVAIFLKQRTEKSLLYKKRLINIWMSYWEYGTVKIFEKLFDAQLFDDSDHTTDSKTNAELVC